MYRFSNPLEHFTIMFLRFLCLLTAKFFDNSCASADFVWYHVPSILHLFQRPHSIDTVQWLTALFVVFILYRQHLQASVAAANPGLPNREISKIIGEKWRNASVQEQMIWRQIAEVCTSTILLNERCLFSNR